MMVYRKGRDTSTYKTSGLFFTLLARYLFYSVLCIFYCMGGGVWLKTNRVHGESVTRQSSSREQTMSGQ